MRYSDADEIAATKGTAIPDVEPEHAELLNKDEIGLYFILRRYGGKNETLRNDESCSRPV